MSVDEATLAAVRAGMRSVKVASHHDRVHKEECAFSFDTPESQGGLYVNLSTFQGFGEDFVGLDHEKTGNVLYLHEKWRRVPLADAPTADGSIAAAKPDKLSLGGEGGFNVGGPKFTLEKEHALVVMPGRQKVPVPCPDLPELVIQAVEAVIAHDSVNQQEAAAVWEEERKVSKYAANMVQLPAEGKRISPNPKAWKCDETGVTENLWLNLHTGHIGSGRANWDGSGGNGSALRHYEATGCKYPLVVKLGTITPAGGDVFSYAEDENDMVLDPQLAEHLAHWGINMMAMEKTEKTMAELQIDLNMSYDFDKISEAGAALKPLQGPGLTGLINLGNSCYMNSVLQVLCTVPELSARYVAKADTIRATAPPDPSSDLPTQLSKVAVALLTGRTGHAAPPATAAAAAPVTAGATAMDVDAGPSSAPAASADDPATAVLAATAAAAVLPEDERVKAVKPQAFKALVGRGHPEFSTARQQDAAEYFTHLLELISRAEHAHADRLSVDATSLPTSSAFKFELEDRTQCLESRKVSYKRAETAVLLLNVPLEAAVNKSEVENYKGREAKRQRLKEANADVYISAGGGGGRDSNSSTATSLTAGPEEAVEDIMVDGDDGVAGAGGGGGGGVVVAAKKEEPVVPRVPFEACLSRFAAAEVVDDYRSAALGGRKTTASKSTRFATFPPYLMVQMQRYFQDQDWTYKKMEVLVEVPDSIDLEGLRSSGLAPGEELQPADVAPVPAPGAVGTQAGPVTSTATETTEPQPELVATLMEMGFAENGCKRAAVATRNSGLEPAMEWILGHMQDPDFNDPLPAPGPAPDAAPAAAAVPGPEEDVEKLSSLTAMGFSETHAKGALKACSGSLERAADWLFSHMDDLDAAVATALSAGSGAAAPAAAAVAGSGGAAAAAVAGAQPQPAASGGAAGKVLDGKGRYELVGFISHVGSNLACGHYVCHIKKDGRWVIFNDDKVAESESPPRAYGYLYMFKRIDA